jgi:hypothetical protein
MAQHDLLITQDVAVTGIQFTERRVNLGFGGLISMDNTNIPTVLAAGTNNHVLTRDDTTVTGLAWKAILSSAGGSDTHVQFNDGGVFGGTSGMIFDKVNNHFTVTGRLRGSNFLTDTTSHSTLIGVNAGYSTSHAAQRYSVLIGRDAGYSLTTTLHNIHIGYYAGRTSIGVSNIYIGSFSGHYSSNADNNVCVGLSTGVDLTGSENTIIGSGAGSQTTTGIGNVFIGRSTGSQNTTLSKSIFIGYKAGLNSNTSNCLIIDSQNTIDFPTNSIVYGLMNTTPANQELWFNSKLYFRYIPVGTTSKVLFFDETTKAVTYGDAPSGGSMVYPDAGVAVSTGTAWGTSIDASTLLTTNTTQNVTAAKTFGNSLLKMNNPANTAAYTFTASAIAGARTITLPLLTASDTMAVLAFTQTFTNKTINATNNTISDTSQAVGDLLKNSGTKFVRFARGTANQVLSVNSGGTDLAWTSIDSVYMPLYASVPTAISANTTIQTGATETTYRGSTTRVTAACTVTFNTSLAIGFQCTIISMTTGNVVIAVSGTSATLRSVGAKTTINSQYEGVTIVKVTATEFILMGALK